MRTLVKLGTAALAAILLVSCGMEEYGVVGWKSVDIHGDHFEHDTGDFKVHMSRPHFFRDSTDFMFMQTITNTSGKVLVFESAEFDSLGSTHQGEFSGRNDSRWRTVEPNEAENIFLWFKFKKPLSEVLGPSVVVRVGYRVADSPLRVVVLNLQLLSFRERWLGWHAG